MAESAPRVRRVYRRPPVVEAVVDFHVTPSPGIELGQLASLHQEEAATYKNSRTLLTSTFKLDALANAVVESSQQVIGFRYSDEPERRVIQARLNGLSFSRVAPYEPWETWRDEAHRLWRKYCEVAKPARVQRLAVRYINRIDIAPKAGHRLRDFILVHPEIPDAIPNRVAGFLMRLELSQPDIERGTLILNVGRTESATPGVVSVLLDLDLFQIVDMDISDSAVWNAVEQLHDRENLYFESCITDRARTLFD